MGFYSFSDLSPWRVALAYLVIGFGMLLFSDYVLPLFADDPLLAQLQGFKGALEVFVTAIILYVVLRVAFDELFLKSRVLDRATVGVTMTESGQGDAPIQFVNNQFRTMTGYSTSDLLGENHETLWAESAEDELETFREACRTGESDRVELECEREDGTIFVDSVQISPVFQKRGTQKVAVFHRDVTEKRDYERRLERSLENNRTLLREIHHRVKNNLQVLLSIIGLQMREVDDERASECLRKSRERIRSMGLIHEKLYESDEMSAVDFEEYVEELVREILQSRRLNQSDVRVSTTIESAELEVDFIVRCGLIINELVTNALEHGQSEQGGSDVTVTFRRVNSHFRLEVADNGEGTPEDLGDGGLGVRLVRRIAVDQLNGEVDAIHENGLTVVVTLPVPDGPANAEDDAAF